MSDEERLLNALRKLHGVATPQSLAKELGWNPNDEGTLKCIGLIAAELARRGCLKKRRHTVTYHISEPKLGDLVLQTRQTVTH